MSFWNRITHRLFPTLTLAQRQADGPSSSVLPPVWGTAPTAIDTTKAASIPALYRALDVLSVGCGQLTIDVERRGVRLDRRPSLVRSPSLELDQSEWISAGVLSLACNGNAFLLKRRGPNDEVIALEPLNPWAVSVWRDQHGTIRYGHDSHTYTSREIAHLTKMRLPGALVGFGPIQAARAELASTLGMRDYTAAWWDTTGQPAGILTSDQVLTGDDARRAVRRWNNLDDEGKPLERTDNPSRVKVLGKGLTYAPLLLRPSDVMWLDAKKATALEIARLFGMPSSLMLAAPDGSSQTYANVEQEWVSFVRFTLMGYLRPLERAISAALPHGQDARFRVDALLRSDTKSRYDSYAVGLAAGFLTIEEVRAWESLPALNPTDAPAVDQTAGKVTA